jgi:hypothetical protein
MAKNKKERSVNEDVTSGRIMNLRPWSAEKITFPFTINLGL